VFATSSFDHYQTKTSRIHKLDSRVKLIITLLFILSNVLLPDGAWVAFGLSWFFLLFINILSKIGLGFTLKRSMIAIPFALAAVTIIFTLPGTALVSFTIGNWDLSISNNGLMRFISILLRSWLSVQAAILLTATTKFTDMAHSLRHLGAPLILITIISFMYRYIFVLSDEAIRLLRARTARSAKKSGHKNPPVTWQAKVAGNMIGQLFLRSYEHSDQVYNAMLARGFQGEFLTLTPHKMKNTDWIALFLALGSILVFQLFTHL